MAAESSTSSSNAEPSMVSASRLSSSIRRAATATLAPRSAALTAAAWPMPEDAR
jgi:hypothetical protein